MTGAIDRLLVRVRPIFFQTLSRLFANLDDVTFRIADFEELRAAAILDWAGGDASAVQILVGLLQVGAKNHWVIVSALISGSLNFPAVAEQDRGIGGSWQL